MVLCGAAWCLMTNGICILDKTMMYWRDWSEQRMYSTTMTSARQESENQRKRENLHSILKCEIFYFHYQSLHCSEPTWQWIVSLASSPDPIDCGQQQKRNSDDDSMKRKICTSFRWASPSISHQLRRINRHEHERTPFNLHNFSLTQVNDERWNH